MTDLDLNDFEIGRELRSYPERRVLAAVHNVTGEAVRLTQFSAEISLRPEFRRAVKMDRAMLAMLKHQSILKFRGYGEAGGALFLVTDACELAPISDQLNGGLGVSCEDLIEIGWQVCSALQLAHNLGLAHGGLSAESILLSDNVQVTVVDFGVARWLKAASLADAGASSGPALITISALASRQDVEQDLRQLAGLLVQLLQTCDDNDEAEPGKVPMRVMLERLLARFEISDPASAVQRPSSAREFQGRLGEMLIGTGDDSMPLVDHRNAAATSRRSIVVELFEPPQSVSSSDVTAAKPATFAWRKQFLPIIAIIVAVMVLWLLADRLL